MSHVKTSRVLGLCVVWGCSAAPPEANEVESSALTPQPLSLGGPAALAAPSPMAPPDGVGPSTPRFGQALKDASLLAVAKPLSATLGQAAAACTGLQLTRWPLDGTNGVDWVIHNYTDRDAATGTIADYTGKTGAAARTYDGHAGADIGIGSFRRMDAGTALVYPAAPGTVTGVVQNNFDRNQSCTGNPNIITIDHGNGFTGTYWHLKKNSARVKVGQKVTTSTVLAVVGSSGCSTAPHLHFQLECGGNVLEPFKPNLWSSAPVYRPTSQVIETSIQAGGAPTTDKVEDPPPDATVLPPNSWFGAGVIVGADSGDVIHLRLRRPDGSLYSSTDYTAVEPPRFGLWYYSFAQYLGGDGGQWSLEAQVNGGRTITKYFKTSQTTLVQVAEASFQNVFNDLVAKGYRETWIDTFSVSGNYYYNAIFQLSDGRAWYSLGGLTGSQLTTEFANLPAGYRPIGLEAYARGSALNYNVIFAQQSGPAWTYYFGQTDAQAQTKFNQFVASGYRQLTSSVAVVSGVRYNAGLYDKSSGGAWVSANGINDADYTALFNQQAAAGNHQSYLDVDLVNGSYQYATIFDGRAVGAWSVWLGMNVSDFNSTLAASESGGELTRLVRGYPVSGSATFGGIWSASP